MPSRSLSGKRAGSNRQSPDSPPPTDDCDNTTSKILLVSGMAVYGLGGPISHAAHGHWDKAGLSLGLRAAPVMLGSALSAADAPRTGMAVLFGGMVAMAVFDDVVIANDEVTTRDPSVSVVPSFDPTTRTGALVFAGAF